LSTRRSRTTADCAQRGAAFRGQRGGISLQTRQCPRAIWVDLRAVRHEVVRASGTKGILLRFGRLLSPSLRRCRRRASGSSSTRWSRTSANRAHCAAASGRQRGGVSLQTSQCPRAVRVDLRAVRHVIVHARGTKRILLCFGRLLSRRRRRGCAERTQEHHDVQRGAAARVRLVCPHFTTPRTSFRWEQYHWSRTRQARPNQEIVPLSDKRSGGKSGRTRHPRASWLLGGIAKSLLSMLHPGDVGLHSVTGFGFTPAASTLQIPPLRLRASTRTVPIRRLENIYINPVVRNGRNCS
jgi:hypothetical protein